MKKMLSITLLLLFINSSAFGNGFNKDWKNTNNLYSQGFDKGYQYQGDGDISGPTPPHITPPLMPGEDPYIAGVVDAQKEKHEDDYKGLDPNVAYRFGKKLNGFIRRHS